MKQNFIFFRFVFLFLVIINGSRIDSFAQTDPKDTTHFITLIDSCKAVAEVQCGEDLLKLVQQKLNTVQNDKERTFYLRAEIKILRNIGNTYRDNLSNLSKAIEYYQLSRKKAEQVVDKLGLAAALLNIGNIHYDFKNFPKAIEYQEKSLAMFREIGDKRGIGICLNSIGGIYLNQVNNIKALEYYKNSLAIQEERKDTFEIMTCYYNIGQAYYQGKSNIPKAMEYFKMGLRYAEAINNAEGTINALQGIGNILKETGKLQEAKVYYTKALELANNSANLSVQSESYLSLREVFEKLGLYKEALTMFDKYIALRDNIFSKEQVEAIANRDAKYESDKKEEIMREQQAKKDAIAAAESRRQQLFLVLVGAVAVAILIIAFIIFRSLRTTRKQKNIIELQKLEVENQKHIVEVKQREIIDSITYAKRLQEAILPPLEFIKKHIPDSFILYKPKDIVAGDFYWMEVKDDIVFVAAADCTGHGVPGAMVSVVCCNALNRAIKEFSLKEPGMILDKVTELVLETFAKSDQDVSDGMDISLLSINKTTREIKWSGANNELWYIADNEIVEVKANKQPIGKHDNPKPFVTHNIHYVSDTIFYLLTDGYPDQFGGPKGKKFKYRQLEEKLVEIKHKKMEEQKLLLNQAFEEWKGTQEQVDDVTIIGIRI